MQKSRIFSFCYTKDLIICNVAKERNFLKCLTEFLLKLIFFCFLSVLLILMIFWPFLDINFMRTLLSKIIVSSYFPAMLRLNSILDSKKNVENWQAFKWNCFANKVKSSTTPEESSIAQIGAHFSNKTESSGVENEFKKIVEDHRVGLDLAVLLFLMLSYIFIFSHLISSSDFILWLSFFKHTFMMELPFIHSSWGSKISNVIGHFGWQPNGNFLSSNCGNVYVCRYIQIKSVVDEKNDIHRFFWAAFYFNSSENGWIINTQQSFNKKKYFVLFRLQLTLYTLFRLEINIWTHSHSRMNSILRCSCQAWRPCC